MILNDDGFRTVLDLLTFAWLLAWAVKAGRNLLAGRQDTVCFLFLTHFVFCGVPLLLDHTVGRPDYRLWPGFNIAAADGATALVYCLYVAACPVLWWMVGRSKTRAQLHTRSATAISLRNLSWQGRTLLHLAIVSPLVMWCLSPNPGIYAEYAGVIHGNFSPEELAFHPLLSASAVMSVVAGASLLFVQRRLKWTCAYVLPFAVFAAWIDGKRYIVLIIIVLFGSALWSRGVLRRRALLFLTPALALSFWGFSAFYQSELRGFDAADAVKKYDNIRLDYGREHVIRLSLYADLHPETEPILEYRMQSLLFDATMLIPRRLWPEKPWPYAVYATAAAFRIPPRDLGWGITTSWLEEAVASFGLGGLLIGPLVLAGICRLGDAAQDTIVRLLTILVSSMFLAVQLPAFAPLLAIWWISLVVAWRARRAAAQVYVCPGEWQAQMSATLR